jgi:hypothetical protein
MAGQAHNPAITGLTSLTHPLAITRRRKKMNSLLTWLEIQVS